MLKACLTEPMQINFELTFAIMLSLYAFIAFGEFLCVLLAVSKFDSLHDAINASDEKEITMTTLHPTNVYQNLSIGGTVVGMVFVTQCILISFVVSDQRYISTRTINTVLSELINCFSF